MAKKKPYRKTTIMRLCPNCRTIQKVGTNCSICKCPINKKEDEDEDKR